MERITTLLALVIHFALGLVRIALSILSGIIMVLGIIALAAKIVVRGTWQKFARGYTKTWNVLYARLGKPVCEICKQSKLKDRIVVYQDCCDRWAHSDCHLAEKVAKMIHRGNTSKAAAFFALKREGKVPLALHTLIRCLRELRGDEYLPALFGRVARVKMMSLRMSMAEAMFVALTG